MLFKVYGRETFQYAFSILSPNCPIRPKYELIELLIGCFINYEYKHILKTLMTLRSELRQ